MRDKTIKDIIEKLDVEAFAKKESKEFVCGYCGLSCTAHKQNGKVTIAHMLPACEGFEASTPVDFMREANRAAIEKAKGALC